MRRTRFRYLFLLLLMGVNHVMGQAPAPSNRAAGEPGAAPTSEPSRTPSSAAATTEGRAWGFPVFPGAEGYGTIGLGGRGLWNTAPRVLFVTTLKDKVRDVVTGAWVTAPGSLRAALETSGPRFILFKVGGAIILDEPIRIDYPYVYIAGQTAPSPGVTIAHHGISVRTNDVIFRYLRFRSYFEDGKDTLLGRYMQSLTLDRRGNHAQIAANKPVTNVIIDHCSFTWSIDDTIGIDDSVSDFTVQWSIIAEAGVYGHDWGPGSLGMLCSIDDSSTASRTQARGSIHHNLFAHNGSRNPKMTAGGAYDFRNNVIYNWKEPLTAQLYCGASFNFINNWYLAGLDSPTSNANLKDIIQVTEPGNASGLTKLYLSGNLGPRRTNANQNEWDIGVSYYIRNNGFICSPVNKFCQVELLTPAQQAPYALANPVFVPTVATDSAIRAAERVLERAGVNGPFRDSVESRIADEVSHVISTSAFTAPAPGYNPKNDPLIHRLGPNDGTVATVVWFKPTMDPAYACLPRQYRVRTGQSIEEAKLALLRSMTCTFSNGLRLPNDASIILADPERFPWEVNTPKIPDAALVYQLYPANLHPPLPPDSDGDGIPDANERQMGTDPARPDSTQDRNGDGYLNIEEYINSLAY